MGKKKKKVVANRARGEFVLHFLLGHGRPRLQQQHELLEVLPPLPSRLQQLQEEGVALVFALHVLDVDLMEEEEEERGGRRERRRERTHINPKAK